MSLDRGSRVIATRDLGGGLFSSASVDKGDEGVVINVDGFFAKSYDVRFENGDTVRDLKEREDIVAID